MNELTANLNEAVRRIVEQFQPEKVILFGSHARGEADERSDFDLVVLCNDFTDRWNHSLRIGRSLYGLRFPCDILVLSPDEFEAEKTMPGSVVVSAAQEGRVLYECAA